MPFRPPVSSPPGPSALIDVCLNRPRDGVPGIRAAGRCRPARDGVSGDFIDVFPASGGGWAAVIGDVCGNGAEAAAIAAAAHRAVRRTAGSDLAPRDVLGTFNAAMLSEMAERERFLTAVYVDLRLRPGGVRAAVCSAGHPPVLVARADGSVHQLGAGGTVLGVTADPRLAERYVLLQPGDTMLLYTDGVTEAHRDGEYYGEDRLRRLLRRIGGFPPAAVAELVERAALRFGRPDECDDIAVLALRVG
ncbi:PP2C family protein-serine/threonine phosphatase [Actinomadura sp. GTD37]|uniref:PP2C family protein-serine/threonine phosphatase n=1 Tax=Actinomadura sp. GTD37 TaxID=1778030 RepID=UPI0035C10B5E